MKTGLDLKGGREGRENADFVHHNLSVELIICMSHQSGILYVCCIVVSSALFIQLWPYTRESKRVRLETCF